MGNVEEACYWYELALERGVGLSIGQIDYSRITQGSNISSILDWDAVFNCGQEDGESTSHTTIKSACNLSVCYEKMGNRHAALDILFGLKKKLLSNRVLKQEYGVYLEGLANNLGVILRRNGQIKQA